MGDRRYRRRQTSWYPSVIISAGILFIVFAVVRIHFASESISGRPSIRSGLFSGNRCPTTPPSPPLRLVHTNGTFSWGDVAPKHPVSNYTKLPTEKPLELSTIQHRFRRLSAKARAKRNLRRDAVKATFVKCWRSYKKYAWGHDELSPISGEYKDTYGGWGATLVDNLDTLLIMDLHEEFEYAVEAAANVSFAPEAFVGLEVNIFETIIRYLGGLLSAYDLAGCGDQRLLAKAVEVADMAYAAFDTENRMPLGRWRIHDFAQDLHQASRFGSLAEMASFSLEFSRLSMLTGDMKYFDAAERVTKVLAEQQNSTLLPGMFPENADLQTPDLTTGTVFTLGANADSAFEYFAKMYQLLGGRGPMYRKLYEYSMDVAIDKLIFKPRTHDGADILIAGDWHAPYNGFGLAHLEPRGQHLTSFAAGMLMLGGRLFDNQTHVDVGRKLADGCAWVYQHMPSGIMAETWSMTPCPSKNGTCTYDPLKAVFTSFRDTRYLLRPEAIEAIFYAYRITGDERYQDIAWTMFNNINNKTSTELANAELQDVTKEQPDQVDNMQSFWMAETLKYFYLMFSEPDFISLDEWVFNTEAHPLRVPQSWRKKVSQIVEIDVDLDL
ncbi:uncharacterized protein PV09_08939 [Verruconis gallopava]|uniref:alpha-1,2-Mannosidase n=1 Tax=Verruconis gallopava TaxID=253628 RepID=A0A0D1YF69_9PEZI|nr:uncharacterized protein PV09_08939 [Verruconis gallopava]KIV99396.1 hypothetical protein PV09_08939 [Verruconis gallopava]